MHVPSDGSALAGTWTRTRRPAGPCLGGLLLSFSLRMVYPPSLLLPPVLPSWLNDSGRTSFLLKLKVREPSATPHRRSPPADCWTSAAEVLPVRAARFAPLATRWPCITQAGDVTVKAPV